MREREKKRPASVEKKAVKLGAAQGENNRRNKNPSGREKTKQKQRNGISPRKHEKKGQKEAGLFGLGLPPAPTQTGRRR
jgi:hypothetical protein